MENGVDSEQEDSGSSLFGRKSMAQLMSEFDDVSDEFLRFVEENLNELAQLNLDIFEADFSFDKLEKLRIEMLEKIETCIGRVAKATQQLLSCKEDLELNSQANFFMQKSKGADSVFTVAL